MNQNTITVSPQAAEDLETIWVYIAQDSRDAADRFVLYIQGVFESILMYPLSGRARPELRNDLRSAPYGNYLILYRPTDSGIDIVRIVHGARDLEALF